MIELTGEPLFRTRETTRSESPGVLVVRALRFIAGWLFTIVFATLCIALSSLGMRRWAWKHLPRSWARTLLRLCAIRVHVENPAGLRGPAMFASNHHSFIDIVFVVTLLPNDSRYVVRKMLREIPFFGWAAGDGLVALDRGNSDALATLHEGLADLPAGWSISIYPEGTRTEDGRLGPLRKGVFYMALQSRLPIVPIGSWGAAGIIPLETILPRSGPIEVTVGAPIATTGWSADSFDANMATLHAALLEVTERSRRRYEARYGVCEPHRRAGSVLHELRGSRPAGPESA